MSMNALGGPSFHDLRNVAFSKHLAHSQASIRPAYRHLRSLAAAFADLYVLR